MWEDADGRSWTVDGPVLETEEQKHTRKWLNEQRKIDEARDQPEPDRVASDSNGSSILVSTRSTDLASASPSSSSQSVSHGDAQVKEEELATATPKEFRWKDDVQETRAFDPSAFVGEATSSPVTEALKSALKQPRSDESRPSNVPPATVTLARRQTLLMNEVIKRQQDSGTQYDEPDDLPNLVSPTPSSSASDSGTECDSEMAKCISRKESMLCPAACKASV